MSKAIKIIKQMLKDEQCYQTDLTGEARCSWCKKLDTALYVLNHINKEDKSD